MRDIFLTPSLLTLKTTNSYLTHKSGFHCCDSCEVNCAWICTIKPKSRLLTKFGIRYWSINLLITGSF